MKRKKKGKPDEWAFKTLINNSMKITQEHKVMLGKFIITQGYKMAKGKDDKTFDEVYDVLNETLNQVKKLQHTYIRYEG